MMVKTLACWLFCGRTHERPSGSTSGRVRIGRVDFVNSSSTSRKQTCSFSFEFVFQTRHSPHDRFTCAVRVHTLQAWSFDLSSLRGIRSAVPQKLSKGSLPRGQVFIVTLDPSMSYPPVMDATASDSSSARREFEMVIFDRRETASFPYADEHGAARVLTVSAKSHTTPSSRNYRPHGIMGK